MTDDHPLDTCECGDFRRYHLGGSGPCAFTKGGRDLTNAFRGCKAFRLSKRHEEAPTADAPKAVLIIPLFDEEKMVEVVARAMCEADGDDPERMTYTTMELGVFEPYGPAWTRHTHTARAAIRAINGGEP